MSLYGSLFSGVTGLNAQSLALGVISENITNVNTTGFKSRTTNFATMVSGNGIEAGSVGGVRHVVSKQTDAQGIVQATTNDTDLAISGGGFFVVNSKVDDGRAVGDTMFTRAGHFAIDEDRQLANASGHFLMGWKLNTEGEFTDAAGNPITPDPTSESDLVPVDLSDVTFSSQATEEVKIQASFPATLKVGNQFDVSVPIFDGLGSTHAMDFSFTKADLVDFNGSIDETLGAVTTFNNIA
ncbi:MAG: flagellar hook-basal body complex protein, partial [Alphaproteobacteria bacterium]